MFFKVLCIKALEFKDIPQIEENAIISLMHPYFPPEIPGKLPVLMGGQECILDSIMLQMRSITRCLFSYLPFANIWGSKFDFHTIKLTSYDMAFKIIDNNASRVWLNGEIKFLMFRGEQLLYGWFQGTNFWLR